jgi:hypothetical protein
MLDAVGIEPSLGAADVAFHIFQRDAGFRDVLHEIRAEGFERID